MRFNYPLYHQYYVPNDTIKPGDDYYDFLSLVNLNDSEFIELPEYINTVNSYLNYKVKKKLEGDTTLKNIPNSNTTVKLRLANELFSNEDVKNLMLYKILHQHIKDNGIYKTENLIADFEKKCTNREYVANIRKEYDKLKIFAEGNPAPQFAYPDINGDVVSLNDFKGKYVYVDVWATWCGPCKTELPHLEKLQEEFKDKNIVFVSISIDDDQEPWKKMIKEKNMKGVQLFAKGWKSAIMKDYKINGIPQFILIDREGKIINVQAPRPSGNIKEVLEKLEGIQT